jgi:acyl carrier protein
MMLTNDKFKDLFTSAGLEVDSSIMITDELPFADLGLDSLDIFNLFLAIETEFGVEVPDEDIDSLITIGALKVYVNEKI